MEITRYLSIARRWAWLLILGLVLGTGIGYGSAKMQTPIYQSSTRVVVSRASMQTASGASGSTGNMYDFFLSDQILIQTYVELLKTSSIFDNVSSIVNYPVSAGQVTAQQVPDTRIISITAEDADPQHAAEIANAVVQALIAQNETLEAGRYKSSDDSLQIQISQVESQIEKFQTDLDNLSTTTVDEQLVEVQKQMAPLQAEVTQLQKDIAILTPAWSADRKSKVTELQSRLDQIQPLLVLYQQIYTNLTVSGTSGTGGQTNVDPAAARLEKTLSLYQQIYLNLINTREAIRLARMQNTQSVNQIEPAVPPGGPVRPIPMQSTLLGAMIGLMLAGGIVFLIEYLDDTLKAPEDVERILELPMIGYIADIQAGGNESANGSIGIYVSKQPRSPVAEAFRSLRTNLEFASVDKPIRTILVTSAEASDGKSTVSANLAAIFAQGGKRVLLIDCDLRRPHVHRFIGVQNRIGMTDLFRGSHTLDEVIHTWTDSGAIEISVITSGSLPPNPAELLGSQKMDHILDEMTARADIVIIDSPPSMVTDAQVLAAKVDGVVLVVQPNKTHAGAARVTREQLDRAGAHIIGVVFNRIPRQHGYYYGGYRYYSPYYYQNSKYLTEHNSNSKFEQHSFEADETVFQSFVKRLSNLVSRPRTAEIEAGKENNTAPAPLLKSVLNPAGWESVAANKTGQAEESPTPIALVAAPVSLLHKTTSVKKKRISAQLSSHAKKSIKAADEEKILLEQSLLRKVAEERNKALARHSAPPAEKKPEQKKTSEPLSPGNGLTVDQKKARPQPLLRKAAQRTAFASATQGAKFKLQPKINVPAGLTIIRPSSLFIPSAGFVTTDAPSNRSADILVGTDYKFLIHKASEGENLERYAAKYNTDLRSIAAVNYKMPSPAWIIPVGFTEVAKLPSFLVHEVRERGTTIEALARELKVNLPDLKYYNGIRDTENILNKNWLLIPQTTLPASDHILIPVSTQSKKHQLDAPVGSEHKFVIHRVSGEDNLHNFASTYKTSMEAILTITATPPLWSGTLAVIPVGLTDVSNLPRFEVHEVQGTGRTVESLAQELNADPRKLSYYNDITAGEKLQSGDWLLIPRTRSSALWRSAYLNPTNASRA